MAVASGVPDENSLYIMSARTTATFRLSILRCASARRSAWSVRRPDAGTTITISNESSPCRFWFSVCPTLTGSGRFPFTFTATRMSSGEYDEASVTVRPPEYTDGTMPQLPSADSFHTWTSAEVPSMLKLASFSVRPTRNMVLEPYMASLRR